jgi:acyl-ACP thioesterase
MGDLILNAAGLAAAENGFGMNDMHAKGIAWVVSRLTIKMDSFPKEYETCAIETWIAECGRMASTRNFHIFDIHNNLIGEASSIWSIIDLSTRKAVDLREYTNFLSLIENDAVTFGKPARVEDVNMPTATAHHKVSYSDIDMNRHTNSMKYLQWALDMCSMEQFENKSIVRCDINYSHEILFEENVTLLMEQKNSDDKEINIFEQKNNDGISCCRVAIEWK